MLAAPASGQGKTTVTFGLLAAWRARGIDVAPFKVGPDYIDPGYHALATGRPGRNLDPWLVGEERIAPLTLHGARGADLAVIEGVMGLYDGRLGLTDGRHGFGSTAHVATMLAAPVVLVVDASHSSRTAAAVAHGLATHPDAPRVAGVIINQGGSPRAVAELRDAFAQIGLPVFGAVPRAADVVVPSRHLGLIPAAERDQARAVIDSAANVVADHVDLDALVTLAHTAPPLTADAWDPQREVTPVPGRPRIAVAAGRAFTFRYAETTELLEAAGCDVVEFDPVSDPALPEGTSALYLGGGFPEMYAAELAANTPLRQAIGQAVTAGLPTYAECAGLLYLARSLDGMPMTGALPIDGRMTPRLTLGYREWRPPRDSLVARTGELIRHHEFHKTIVEPASDSFGFAPHLHASYHHIHWAGYPAHAQRFAAAAAAWDPSRLARAATPDSALIPPTSEPAPADQTGSAKLAAASRPDPAQPAPAPAQTGHAATPPPDTHSSSTGEPDLHHHGDADLAPNLVDLAVNVWREAPDWLLEAIAEVDLSAYPNPGRARRALAERHGVPESMVLPTAGAAEAFTLIARALRPRQPVVVHPQFTEPEAALLAAGHPPRRLLLTAPDFRLDPSAVDPTADALFLGNPTNPTGVLHPPASIDQLALTHRVLVVDEAFADAIPADPTRISAQMPNTLVIRSLTKAWGIPGLRAGYVVGDPQLIERLAAQQPPWSVSSAALHAMALTSSPDAVASVARAAAAIPDQRAELVAALTEVGCRVAGEPRTPFVLADTSNLGAHSVRPDLAELGFAVRRGESFPGLGPTWIRIAVRNPEVTHALREALRQLAGRA